MLRRSFPEGHGWPEHTHTYSHPIYVIEGEFLVRTGGVTRLLKAGDSLMHYKGTTLTGVATNGPAVVEADHSKQFDED
jgi:quercetin dioxygenase-like cupin family protein